MAIPAAVSCWILWWCWNSWGSGQGRVF